MSEGVWERSMTGAMEQSKGRRAMEHRIIFATSNQGKMREIREILKGLGTEILSMKEAGVQIGHCGGWRYICGKCGNKGKGSLGGRPAALSWQMTPALWWMPWAESRAFIPRSYMGEKTSYEIKNWNLIHRLAECSRKKAHRQRFVCVIAAVAAGWTGS